MTTLSKEIKATQQRFGIIGKSPLFTTAIEQALKVATVDLSVLIIGESGSGKEVFPKIIHENSKRRHEKYMAVKCGAIPAGTINSELFGHEKGSFTGAISDHKGYFEDCNGGTLFLDEVAELPLETQALLLRVLESGEYMRVGSSDVRKTDVRIVAATNKNLESAIKEGKFREDLYYRLCSVRIDVPPLRKRGDDIWLLIRKFSHDFSERYRTPEVEYTDDAKAAMLSYRWPGNVRQLKNVAEQIALFEAGKVLGKESVTTYIPQASGLVSKSDAEFDYKREREYIFKLIFKLQADVMSLQESLKNQHLPSQEVSTSLVGDSYIHDVEIIKRPTKIAAPQHLASKEEHNIIDISNNDDATATEVDTAYAQVDAPHVKTLEETERETITRALDRNSGKRKKTAEELNISERTLYRKIKAYGLESRNQHKE